MKATVMNSCWGGGRIGETWGEKTCRGNRKKQRPMSLLESFTSPFLREVNCQNGIVLQSSCRKKERQFKKKKGRQLQAGAKFKQTGVGRGQLCGGGAHWQCNPENHTSE